MIENCVFLSMAVLPSMNSDSIVARQQHFGLEYAPDIEAQEVDLVKRGYVPLVRTSPNLLRSFES